MDHLGPRFQPFNAIAVAVCPPTSNAGPTVASLTYDFADNTSEPVDMIIAPWFSSGSIFDGPIFTLVSPLDH